jgi:hypothetical protein
MGNPIHLRGYIFLSFVLALAACGGSASGDHPTIPPATNGATEPPASDAPPTESSDADSLDAYSAPPPSPSADPPLPPCARTVSVASTAELNSATSAAKAGDCIVLADGHYTFQTINRTATAASPIVVRAAHAAKAVVSAGGLDVRGAYVVIEGLSWTSNGRFSFSDCSHCRLTRNRFQPVETADNVDWITVTGKSDSCRIDHNDVGPRTRIGNDIMLAGAGPQTVQHTRIDHNFFHDVHRTTGNGWETIRAGLSGWTFSSAFTIIEQNLFKGCDGDPETISMKSSDNVLRYNTMRANNGQLVLRHGNRSSVYGNIILGDGVAGSGGIRVLGGDHKIWNNYIAGVDGTGIELEGGESNDSTGNLTDHKQVYRAQVVFNTIVAAGKQRAISVGGGHPMDPIDCTVANNLFQGAGPLMSQTATSKNTSYAGNIVNGAPGLSRSPSEVRIADPKLVKAGDLLKVAAGSVVIGAAAGTFSFVTDDFEGQARAKGDVGADELSQAPVLHGLLSEKDVGPDAP